MGHNHKTWYNLGKNPFGIRSYLGNYPFGKLSVWEIIIWEKIHLGKYPTACTTMDKHDLEYTVYICLILYFYSVTQFFLAFSEVFYVIFLDFSFPILIFFPQRSRSLKMDNATDPDKTGAHFNFPILGEIFQLSFLPAVQEVLSNLRKILTI